MAASAAPGWYHAQGDPLGTERFWDGSAWTEGPRPVGGVPSSPPAAPTTPPVTETPTFGAVSSDAPIADVSTAETPALSDAPTGGLPPSGNFASAGSPPPQAPGFPGAPPTGAAYAGIPGAVFAEESKATMALVFSILGLFCFITAPVGAFLGYREKVAIDEGRRDPANRGKAVAAIVIGLLFAVGGLFFIGLVAAFGAVASA